jgi:putative ABC transport system permease protein
MKIIDTLDSIGRDVRHALRSLPRRPSFMLTAVLTLALGIAATTAIFSVVYSVLIKPLPYPSSDELMSIRYRAPGLNDADLASQPSMYFTYRAENETFADIGIFGNGGETLTREDGTERIRSLRVSHGVLQAVGVQPLYGRWFTEADHSPSAETPYPIIVSHAFAQNRFGDAEAALGRDLVINGQQAQVLGIMPRDFRFLDMTPPFDIIVAMRFDPAQQTIGPFNFESLARLKPGVTPEQASADLQRMIWLDAWPMMQGLSMTREAYKNWRIAPVVKPLKDDLVGGVASALWVLMGAIGAVLLVACANIANLMLVRADARRGELAVRAALGAVPARLARELLVEALVIGAAGGGLGLALAYGGLELLVRIGPSNLPRLEEIAVYPPVLAFAVAVSLATALGFGTVTALKAALRVDASAFSGSRGSSASRERSAARSALVVVQVALALVLVVSAVLMIRTFQALRDVDPGFTDPAALQTVRTWAPNDLIRDPARYTRLQHEILDAIAAIPGVTSVAFTSNLPIEGAPFTGSAPVFVDGRSVADGETPPNRRFKFVSPGYFETMGTRLIVGRDITWTDIETGGRVAVISEEFAREFGSEPTDALGKRIRPPLDSDDWREVVGVVQGVKDDTLYKEAPTLVYWPAFMENAFGNQTAGAATVAFAVRSDRAGNAALLNEIREAVWSVNRDVPIALERTMQDLNAESLARTSFALVMLAIAGSMALALGLIGIYGVIAYVVAQRTREIGIRMALGARRHEVRKMFLRQGLTLSAVGLGVGLVAALALSRLMSSLLFGISSTDVVTYVAAIGVILAAAALASYLPARRASAIDPINTLKAE